METSDKLFSIPTRVELLITSMNLTVLVLPLDRLGLVGSWRISYDQKGTPEGLITMAPEDSNR
jgi:hypothetical protein